MIPGPIRSVTPRPALQLALAVALAAWSPPGAAQDDAAGTLAGISAEMEVTAANARAARSSGDALKGQVEQGTALAGTVVGAAFAWKDFTEAYAGLTPDDSQFDPDYSPDGSPEVPSACAESEACQACYEKAVRDINFYRFSLEKGRGLARSTLDFAKKAIAFGDSASGSFGVGGLQWSVRARPEIEKAVAKFKKTYNSKYQEWIAGLETSLRTLGRCEEEYFHERDWYARFGYIYATFMADRYRLPDSETP